MHTYALHLIDIVWLFNNACIFIVAKDTGISIQKVGMFIGAKHNILIIRHVVIGNRSLSQGSLEAVLRTQGRSQDGGASTIK